MHGRAGIDDHDVLQIRQPVADLQRLVQLLLVLGDEYRRLTVTEQVLDLRCRRRRIDPDRYRPDSLSADVGEQPLRSILTVNRHPISGTNPQLGQRHADPGGTGCVFAPAVRDPDAELVMAQCGLVAHVHRPGCQHRR